MCPKGCNQHYLLAIDTIVRAIDSTYNANTIRREMQSRYAGRAPLRPGLWGGVQVGPGQAVRQTQAETPGRV